MIRFLLALVGLVVTWEVLVRMILFLGHLRGPDCYEEARRNRIRLLNITGDQE